MDYLKFTECLDEEIRETCLDELFEYSKICSRHEIRQMMHYTLLNLKDGLGQDGEKAYKRSFLLLVCSICLDAQKERKIFSRYELADIHTNIIFFTIKERCFLGYTKYGWLHTLAHLVEVYYRLVELRIITKPIQLKYLFKMLFSDEVVYRDHEYTRVIRLLNIMDIDDLSFLKVDKKLDLTNQKDRTIEINYFYFITQYAHYNHDVNILINSHVKRYHPWLEVECEYDYVIRPSTILDTEVIAKAWNDGDIMAGVGFPCGLGVTYGDVHDIIISQKVRNSYILMIESNAIVMGELSLKPRGKNVEIGIKLYDKDLHGQGIATSVLNKYITILSTKYEKILLNVSKDNIAALKLYEKIGFTKTYVEENAFKDQLGRYHDAIFFEKVMV